LPGAVPSITVGAMSHEVEHRTLARFLEDNQLKHTKQREAILDVFLEITGHITTSITIIWCVRVAGRSSSSSAR
jgi:Fe2+ or Zn2+ uptake regulation protein